ncbi:hypothetical protein CesoFtcFv8_001535 [Champsocephalus esox]|uniref:Uncharacterized protein n=1 Tax=Champsocephalus esox TaxID=159716 RepID=A0AAN8D647_9TELE|nr:hypothetical protein CesoFtcFv8_001535 [Champsocephalus esox]
MWTTSLPIPRQPPIPALSGRIGAVTPASWTRRTFPPSLPETSSDGLAVVSACLSLASQHHVLYSQRAKGTRALEAERRRTKTNPKKCHRPKSLGGHGGRRGDLEEPCP